MIILIIKGYPDIRRGNNVKKKYKQMKKLFLLAFIISVTGLQAQKADQIVQNYLQKIGGQKLDKVHSILKKGTMNMNGMDFPMESYQSSDGKMYTKLKMMGQDIVALAFDGKKGYQFANFSYVDIPDSLTTKFKEKSQNFFGFFYKYKEHGRQLKYLGQQKFDSIQAESLQISFDKPIEGGIKDAVAFFDPETGLLMGIKIVKDGHIIITRTSEYKVFDDISLPTKITIDMDGSVIRTFKFNTIQVNPPVSDPAIFEKPKQ